MSEPCESCRMLVETVTRVGVYAGGGAGADRVMVEADPWALSGDVPPRHTVTRCRAARVIRSTVEDMLGARWAVEVWPGMAPGSRPADDWLRFFAGRQVGDQWVSGSWHVNTDLDVAVHAARSAARRFLTYEPA